MKVNEIARRAPGALGVFKRRGLDACCGGEHTLADACARHGIDVGDLLDELRRAADEAERVSRELDRHF
jgi:iron-sulfur cluster repair protein YtfE (RIC family)